MLVSFSKKEQSPFEKAIEAHTQGRFADAEIIYRQILAVEPNNPDGLHMLGLLYFQAGHPAQGVGLIEQSLALVPNNPSACSNLAEVKRTLGQLDEAAALCQKALALQPDLAAAQTNLAMVLYQQGKYAEALPYALRSVQLSPGESGGYGAAGVILMDTGRLQEALPYLEQSFKLSPNDSTRANALGICYERLEQYDKAFTLHQRAAELSPNNAKVLANVGALLARTERYGDAIGWYNRALEKDPNFLPAIEQLAAAKLGVREFESAIELARRSLAVQPIGSDAYATLGEALMGIGHFDECIAEMLKADAIKPTFAIRQTLSNALVRDGKPQEGLDELEKALALEPSNAVLHFNKSIILLLMGRYAEAWQEYEWRWQHPRMGWRSRQFNRPKWDGSPLDGKRILIHAEQGMGDTIFFGRYITMVAERGGKPIVFVQTSMVEVVKTIAGVTEVIGEGVRMPEFDCHIPIMSLPAVFGTNVDNVPAKVPYISAHPAKKAYWKDELAKRAGGKLKVGLVWEGGPFQPENFLRLASLAAYAPLGEVEGVAFFGLQKGTAEVQAKTPPPGMDFTDLGPFLKDFEDTTAIIDNLDLMISIDTSVVHIAGALAKPLWMFLAYSPGHMWMLERTDSPWYPTMRIFRQPKFKDWATPVSRVKAELEKLVRERRA